ncbi:NAD(P)/FAD-dependent oxidoreductase [Natronobiforma cellulositropha]|uniref:NAD(P)/FAD-dependent oxidoreductase n=1 Tax=Natronobiforma cellulositropha TaxID=1679076 RepID=UPI0021D56D1A|nr:FAD-dependent oxidoreductase [Natronobiforma cellulositropha]
MSAPTVAVVGAGVAAAGVATALADAPCSVTVLERAPAVGGRAATRRRGRCTFDVGANYVTDGSPRVSELVRSLTDEGLLEIESPVWTHDADGVVSPGDDRERHAWSFEDGIATLPRALLERTGATVRLETSVERLEQREDGRWRVVTDGGPVRADAVVLTPPGPALAPILASSVVERPLETALGTFAADAATVAYRTVHSVALHYPFALERPYYALVDTDREHAVGWLAREGEKRGHVPPEETLLIAQLAPEWSLANAETPADETAADVAGLVATLLGEQRLETPNWAERVQWDHALPEEACRVPRALADAGLFLASDCVHGERRLSAALECGLAVGDRLRERFERP